MIKKQGYLMESSEENVRLEKKTRQEAVRTQAHWCGLEQGMRVLDAGCGPGLTSLILQDMVEPGGSVVGLDYSEKRIRYAKKNYGGNGLLEFHLHDLRDPLISFGFFDVIWTRFVLEYNRKESFEIIKNLYAVLKPGGRLCVIDLDYNCLTYYAPPAGMEDMIKRLTDALSVEYNFDPYIGRKLYSFIYDLGLKDIEVDLRAHHLFYGMIGEADIFNWLKKAEVAISKRRDLLRAYPGGQESFLEEFRTFLADPRRFIYTPLILCKGIKPS